jgi:hypothetical protein
VDDARSFRPGVLGGYDSVKGFAVIGSDGKVPRPEADVSDQPHEQMLNAGARAYALSAARSTLGSP